MAELSLLGDYNEVCWGKKFLENKGYAFAWPCQECQSHLPGPVLGGSMKRQTEDTRTRLMVGLDS